MRWATRPTKDACFASGEARTAGRPMRRLRMSRSILGSISSRPVGSGNGPYAVAQTEAAIRRRSVAASSGGLMLMRTPVPRSNPAIDTRNGQMWACQWNGPLWL